MCFQRYYLEKYREKLLRTKRIVDSIISCTPLALLTFIMLWDSTRQLWLICASIFGVIEAFVRYLPFYKKAEEISACTAQMDMMLNEMEMAWNKYKLGLLQESEFSILCDITCKSFVTNISQTVTEFYRENSKYKEYASNNAVQRLNEITDEEIDSLLQEIRG